MQLHSPAISRESMIRGGVFRLHAENEALPRQAGGGPARPPRGDGYGWRGGVRDGLVASEEELTGGIGAARPAVCEPRPSFCRVFASSLPDAFSPCAT